MWGVPWLVGLVLFSAGLSKLLSPPDETPLWLVPFQSLGFLGLERAALIGLGTAECLLAAMWLGPRLRSVAAHISTFVFAGFSVYHLSALATGRGPKSCGCFGSRLFLASSAVALIAGALLGASLWWQHVADEQEPQERVA